MAEYEKFVPSDFLIEKLLDNEITFSILIVFSVYTPVWHSGHQHRDTLRFVNSFDLKSPADAYCYLYLDYNKLNLWRRNLPEIPFQLGSLVCWRFSEYLSIHWGAGSFVTIVRERAKQEELYLEHHSMMLMAVIPACLDPHLRKWCSLSWILRTTYIDLQKFGLSWWTHTILSPLKETNACLTASTDCNVKYVGETTHNE